MRHSAGLPRLADPPRPTHDGGRLDQRELARLLRRVPLLSDAAQGRGPMIPGWPYAPRRRSLRVTEVEALLTGAGAVYAMASLDAQAVALTQLAVWHGGEVTRNRAAAEAPGVAPDQLDAAARQVHDLLLTEPGEWLRLRPNVIPCVDLPGVPAAPSLRHVDTDRLAHRLELLGHGVPAGKAARIDVVVRALRDPDTVKAAVPQLSESAQRALDLLLRHGPQRVADLGVPYWPTYGGGRDSALGELLEHGLIGVHTEDQVCFVWLDVLVGLRGGQLFGPAFPTVPDVPRRPLDGHPVTATDAPDGGRNRRGGGGRAATPSLSLPVVLERLDRLLAHWQARPADALAGGGLGVRAVRDAAKALGAQPQEIGLLAVLTAELGIIGVVVTGVTGRGRNRREQRRWTTTQLVEQWRELTPSHQWAQLVQAWRDSPGLDDLDGLPERYEPDRSVTTATGVLCRDLWLRLLVELPDGAGHPEDDVPAAAAFRFPLMLDAPPRVAALVHASRILGLVPRVGAVGLTAAARALLQGPDVLDRSLPAPSTDLIVQADLTVIAAPDAAPELTRSLARWADLESSAGARIYRLSERRIAAALDAGDDAEAVLAWLRDRSKVGVPQNVEYLVRDVARCRGQVRAGSAATYLRSDDSALLARAVAVRAAKLRLLAPTVAVSQLGREKLLAALTDAGVAAVAEDADGATVQRARQYADRVGWYHHGNGLPPLHEPVAAERMAADLMEAARPPAGR